MCESSDAATRHDHESSGRRPVVGAPGRPIARNSAPAGKRGHSGNRRALLFCQFLSCGWGRGGRFTFLRMQRMTALPAHLRKRPWVSPCLVCW
jgi:hypothetical protein